MAIYLTMVRVLANVEAAGADEARAALTAALDRAGFTPFPEGSEAGDVFESEVDEPDGIPAAFQS
jgi:hypothetical protein